ncbi:MAG: hypothetical protein ACRENC_19375, partial [Gemmatimonadaceae bacterium]
ADADATLGSACAAEATSAREFEQALPAQSSQPMAVNRVIESDMMFSCWRWSRGMRPDTRGHA